MIRNLFIACIAGAVAVGLLAIPFLGAFTVGLILAIVCEIVEPSLSQYCKNSEYVEFGFAWITIHSNHVYFVYWLLFTGIFLAVFTLRMLLERLSARGKAKDGE